MPRRVLTDDDVAADPGIDRTGIRELLKLSPAERARLAVEDARALEDIPVGLAWRTRTTA